jgi:hypothetical protein
MPNLPTEYSVPREWASDEDYSSGSANGTATKVDPGAALAAQGWVPGPVGAQHLNYQTAATVKQARRACTVNPLRLHRLHVTAADTSEAIAAVQIVQGLPTVVIKTDTDGVLHVFDNDLPLEAGTVASITSFARGAAFDPNAERIVAIGVGGNLNCFSDDNGVTWSSGGALGGACQDIVWNDTLGLFLALNTSGPIVRRSADATSWASATTSLSTSAVGGIAVLSSGRTVVCGVDGASFPRFSISDNATAWSDSGGFPDDGGLSFLGEGYICGNGGDVIWHAGLRSSPASALRISKSEDGVTWTTVADFTTGADNIPPGAAQPNTSAIRMLCCQNTGLLVVLCTRLASNVCWAIASADKGVTWSDPAFFPNASLTGSMINFALAGGKLFHTIDDAIESSVGVGVFRED